MHALVLAAVAAAVTYTNTETVQAVSEHDGAIWVTTTGGVEKYDPGTLARLEVTVGPHASGAAVPAVSPRYQGARETVRVSTSAGTLVGTAGAGVWLDGREPRRLTPRGQICGNHVVALAEWKGKMWAATFDAGVCWLDGDHWVVPAGQPFRMTNDVAVTRKGLVIAASEGLFVSRDGTRFERWEHVEDKGFSDLDVDGDVLWATTPGSLWRLPLTRRAPRAQTWWKPGGSRAVQAVASTPGEVWITSEDRGAVRLADEGPEICDRAAGLPTSWHIDVALVAKQVWIATLRHGLLRRDPGGVWTQVAGLEKAWLLFVGPDAGRRGVWVGAQGGLFHVDREGRVKAFDRPLPDPNVHVVWARKNLLWIGTEGGLVRTVTG